MDSVPAVAWLPVAAAVVVFVAYCLYDLAHAKVRYLPKVTWALVCVLSIPIGGVVYLLLGRERQ